MSLLLDALKEAEQSKRRAAGNEEPKSHAAAAQEHDSEPRPLSLAEESRPVPPFAAPHTAVTPPDPRFAEVTKLRVLPAHPGAGAERRVYWLSAALAVLIALLGGGYFYLTRATPATPMPPVAAPLATAPPVATPPPAEHVLPSATLTPQEPVGVPHEARRVPRAPASVPAAGPVPPPTREPIVVVASSTTSPLQAAYAALQGGELARARTLYEQVLAADPAQPDAHLGLGVIAQSGQDRDAAIKQFRAVLAVVPDQPRAWAGLAELAGDGELPAMESRLRGLLATRPEAALHFALGNNLMRQSRWPDAQEEFFAAATAAPDNAEYRFNLAVALDRMGKRDAAAANYATALQLADGRPVQFDTAAARSRLAAITPGVP
jgi:tetratricopeptide (TPR) repeat protein